MLSFMPKSSISVQKLLKPANQPEMHWSVSMKTCCSLFGTAPTHLTPKKYSHGRMCGITQLKKEGNKTTQVSLPAAFQGCLIETTVPNCFRKWLSPFNRKLHGAFEHLKFSVGTDCLGAERSKRTGRLENILIVFFTKNPCSSVWVRVRCLFFVFLNWAYWSF